MNATPLRPSWVEIDVRALENNMRRLQAIVGESVEVLAMVKANAYGHGAIETARAAVHGGATWLGVYSAGEGLELRAAGITARVLVVGPTLPAWVGEALASDLTLTVISEEDGRALAQAARQSGATGRVHLKVNTGMNRLGVHPEQAEAVIGALAEDGRLAVEGIYTHFSVSDDPDARGIPGWGQAFTRQQYELFCSVLARLERSGRLPRYRHIANSPALLNFPEARLNLARTGILLYGLNPSAEVPRPEGFEPALSWKTRLALVREVPRGEFAGYGAAFQAERDTRLGVIMVGYADGFRRRPHNYSEVLVCGRRAPLVGRVCMDQALIDLTAIPQARPGDEVVIIGRQGTAEITADDVAARAGTNNYEVVNTISARVPRLYLQ